MAEQIYEEITFKMMNGTDLLVRPLPIKPLRAFMKKWDDLVELARDKDTTEMDYLDEMLKCAYVIVDFFNPEVEFEEIENYLDPKTMERIVSLGSGIQMVTGDDVPKATTKE